MRVLFLDFDGVINSERWLLSRRGAMGRAGPFDPVPVRLVNQVAVQAGAHIVVSSHWRVEKSVGELRSILERLGMTAPLIDATPVYTEDPLDGLARAREIQAWLDGVCRPEGPSGTVDSFAILDDIETLGHLEPRRVRTTHLRGFTRDLMPKVSALLAEGTVGVRARGRE